MQTLITEHRKTAIRGWHKVRQAPANDPMWAPVDRMWIDELLTIDGADSLVVGDTMYEVQWIRDPS